MKRMFDVLAAAAGLVLLSPVIVLFALWIRLAGERRVFHTEERIGRAGRPFVIHKLRTLTAASTGHSTVVASTDPDITGPGHFLRRWRLDELPQLFDVLRGAMSLVGPRPQQAANLEAIDLASLAILQRVRPGITGPAVVEFLAEDEALAECDDPTGVYRRVVLPEKVRIEVDYVERWSLLLDLRIVLRTVVRVFSRRAREASLPRIRALIAAHLQPSP